MRAASLPGTFAVLLLVSSAAAQDAPPAASVREYCERAAALDPLNPQGFFELGEWCRRQNLEEQATNCFEEAIRLDADHAGGANVPGLSCPSPFLLPRELGRVETGLDDPPR